MSTTLLFAIATFCLALILRIYYYHLTKESRPVDHWYWKAYIETYRNKKQFPPVLPQYLLDEHQWYPPLFPLIMAYLPKTVFDRYNHCISIMIDLLRMLLLLSIASWLSNSDPNVVGIAGIVYATTPILISYNIQLNPRGLGALFLDSLIFLLLWIYLFNGPLWLWVLVFLLAGLILLTHKMTSQIFWFLCLGGGIIAADWLLVALIPVSIFMAYFISKGFYLNVLRAHWDIVIFWTKNWSYLQANPLKESPIYGISGYSSKNKIFKPGLGNQINRIASIFLGVNSLWIIAIFLLILLFNDQNPLEQVIGTWVLLCFLFTLITVIVPLLRGLGFGNLYLYNGAFPIALLFGIYTIREDNYIYLILLVLFVFYFLSIFRLMTNSRSNKGMVLPDSLINEIRSFKTGNWICYPMQYCEQVAYLAGKSVLWGAHGYGFNQVKQVFPVLNIRFESLIEIYGLRYILIEESYLSDLERIDINKKLKLSTSGFYIFEIFKNP